MIDKMIRCKKLDASDKIDSLYEWFYKCPPQGKQKHWKDGRSAKETAKHWLHTIPQPFIDILKPFQLKYTFCTPEYVSKFDSYRGNGRNHDLLILAKNEVNENVVISIESKVDEPFGDTVAKTKVAAETARNKNKNSKAIDRIKELRIALFGKEDDQQLHLRYQLLTAVAGTIAEAKSQKATSAIFLIQTFISDEIDKKKHNQNKTDLDKFLAIFSKSSNAKIENNELLGPFRIAESNVYLSDDIDLWIGKYEIEI
ncbi:DUF6946 family protein [Yeosuana sp.]|uniref:DUF6946 family protein n=1 Tax=Yeosuana sp. TaxID=2529388 RepID=UPI004054B8C9